MLLRPRCALSGTGARALSAAAAERHASFLGNAGLETWETLKSEALAVTASSDRRSNFGFNGLGKQRVFSHSSKSHTPKNH
jgi:hypothetical protein